MPQTTCIRDFTAAAENSVHRVKQVCRRRPRFGNFKGCAARFDEGLMSRFYRLAGAADGPITIEIRKIAVPHQPSIQHQNIPL